ncbi:MAG: hypothetical protein ABIP08_07995, partial [Lautropia sp.]
FRGLGAISAAETGGDSAVRDLCLDREDCDRWLVQYRARLRAQNWPDDLRGRSMNRVNPRFVLRNYLAEAAIRQATAALAAPAGERDFSETSRLAELLQNPFDQQPGNDHYAALPPDWANAIEVSCSS